jgi:hypothetical protein
VSGGEHEGGLREAEAERVVAAFALGVAPVAPPAQGLDRLLAAVANPWVQMLEAFAQLVDLPRDHAERLLNRAERGLDWGPGPLPGMALVHLAGGPATAGADVGIVRLPPDFVFPPHTHLGPEAVLILEGDYEDSAGYVLAGGQGERREPGTPHHFRVGPRGVVFAVVHREGIEVPDPQGGPPIILRG